MITWRPDGVRIGFALEGDGKAALSLGHPHLLVETLAQRHARGLADQLLRIERGSPRSFIEQFAHLVSVPAQSPTLQPPPFNYSSGAFSIGSNRLASSPSRFHDCCMCCGSGAVASMKPPRGCGMTMRRASRCSRFCRPPGSCQFSMLKYLGSPTMGWPICSMWARSWWVRPVTGFSDTQVSLLPAVSTTA